MSLVDAKVKYDLNKIDNKQLNVVISKKAINIIKIFNSANPNTEWSGILFYKLEEENLNFNITVIDILLMDIGTGATTSYDFNADLIYFLEQKEYLMDYLTTIFIGHVHSHNQMSSFFSGVDINELVENSENHKLYVSLIVNNRLEMVAKAVIREEIKQEIVSIGNLGYRTEILSNKYPKESRVVYKLWYYDAIITQEVVENTLTSYLDRLEFIIKEKSKKVNNFKDTIYQKDKKINISEDRNLPVVSKTSPALILNCLINTFDAEATTLSAAIGNLLHSDYSARDICDMYKDNILLELNEHNLDCYDSIVRNQIITQIYQSLVAFPNIRDRLIAITDSFKTVQVNKKKNKTAQLILDEIFERGTDS